MAGVIEAAESRPLGGDMDGVTKLNDKMSDDGYDGQVESRVVISDG